LVDSPERVAQNLLAVFIIGALAGRGLVFRELKSGVGFVDIAVVRGQVIHLLELKVLRSRLTGASQLRAYMRTEQRSIGWLIVFDSRPAIWNRHLPSVLRVAEGTIRVLAVDIRPTVPSRIPESAGKACI
jgi:hypothetical protein